MRLAAFVAGSEGGNTRRAADIFLSALSASGEARVIEFRLPDALLGYCAGCKACMGGNAESCPQADEVAPILAAIRESDAMLFAFPHYGARGMPASMKNLMDHLSFLSLVSAPMRGIGGKKAFILTTGAGSKAGIKPVRAFMGDLGVGRVGSFGIRMLRDGWAAMPAPRARRIEARLAASARGFYGAKPRRASPKLYASYLLARFVVKRFVGEGSRAYELWKREGYFKRRPR